MQLPHYTKLCPACGYLLEGLDDGAICPECGTQTPDDQTILIWGQRLSVGRTPDQVGSQAVAAYIAILMGGVLSIGGTVMFLHAGGPASAIAVTLGLIFVAVGVHALTRRKMSQRFQLRLSPRGCGFRQGLGPVRMQAWTGKETVAVSYRATERIAVEVEFGFLRQPVIVAVEASHDDAIAILQRVGGWIRVAHRTRVETGGPRDTVADS